MYQKILTEYENSLCFGFLSRYEYKKTRYKDQKTKFESAYFISIQYFSYPQICYHISSRIEKLFLFKGHHIASVFLMGHIQSNIVQVE